MAVLVEALSVILRRDVIARRYDGGWPGFVADAVNSTLCADSEIARVGFMHPQDVGAFVQRMERSGLVFLDRTGAAIDMVVVDQREGPTTPCAWIEFFRQNVPGGTVSAVRLAGSQDKGLRCPDGWEFDQSLSHSFEFHPGTKPDESYEFVRHEHGTDVFRERRTGREVYMSRPTSLDAADEESPDPNAEEIYEEHNSLLLEAGELLEPYLRAGTRLEAAEDVARVARACEALERVTSLRSDNWNAWWGLGMARRLIQDSEGAYAAFARAYGINPHEIEVGRNLAAECIALGYAEEAIEVTAAMVGLAPQDAGLIANHALALLIGGNVEGALREVERASELEPTDEVTTHLRRFIEDVRDGRIQAPARMPTW